MFNEVGKYKEYATKHQYKAYQQLYDFAENSPTLVISDCLLTRAFRLNIVAETAAELGGTTFYSYQLVGEFGPSQDIDMAFYLEASNNINESLRASLQTALAPALNGSAFSKVGFSISFVDVLSNDKPYAVRIFVGLAKANQRILPEQWATLATKPTAKNSGDSSAETRAGYEKSDDETSSITSNITTTTNQAGPAPTLVSTLPNGKVKNAWKRLEQIINVQDGKGGSEDTISVRSASSGPIPTALNPVLDYLSELTEQDIAADVTANTKKIHQIILALDKLVPLTRTQDQLAKPTSWLDRIRLGRCQHALKQQLDVLNACTVKLTGLETFKALVGFFIRVVAKYALPGAGIGAAVGAGVGATVGTLAVPVPVLGTLTGASGGAIMCAPCGFIVGLVVGTFIEAWRNTLGACYRRERVAKGTAETLQRAGLFKFNITAVAMAEQRDEQPQNLQAGIFKLLQEMQTEQQEAEQKSTWTTTLARTLLP